MASHVCTLDANFKPQFALIRKKNEDDSVCREGCGGQGGNKVLVPYPQRTPRGAKSYKEGQKIAPGRSQVDRQYFSKNLFHTDYMLFYGMFSIHTLMRYSPQCRALVVYVSRLT